jgi:thioredoxin 1
MRSIFSSLLCGAALVITGCSTPAAAPAEPDPVAVESPADDDARPVLVTFTKPGCPACLRLAPALAEIEQEYASRVRFEEVDTSQVPAVRIEKIITGTPTVIIYRNNNEVKRFLNPKPQVIREALDNVLAAGNA